MVFKRWYVNECRKRRNRLAEGKGVEEGGRIIFMSTF